MIANVQTTEMTSNTPFNTQLSGRVGLYSHIAVVFGMAAIFMMWPMNAIFPMLTTWPKHLGTGKYYLYILLKVSGTHGS